MIVLMLIRVVIVALLMTILVLEDDDGGDGRDDDDDGDDDDDDADDDDFDVSSNVKTIARSCSRISNTDAPQTRLSARTMRVDSKEVHARLSPRP